jgi:hypothetical protein
MVSPDSLLGEVTGIFVQVVFDSGFGAVFLISFDSLFIIVGDFVLIEMNFLFFILFLGFRAECHILVGVISALNFLLLLDTIDFPLLDHFADSQEMFGGLPGVLFFVVALPFDVIIFFALKLA